MSLIFCPWLYTGSNETKLLLNDGRIKYNSSIMPEKSIRFLIITSTLDNAFIIYKWIIVSFVYRLKRGK